jgi:hypothetical protein
MGTAGRQQLSLLPGESPTGYDFGLGLAFKAWRWRRSLEQPSLRLEDDEPEMLERGNKF